MSLFPDFKITFDEAKTKTRELIAWAADLEAPGKAKHEAVVDALIKWLDDDVMKNEGKPLRELLSDGLLVGLRFFINGLIRGEFAEMHQAGEV